MVGWLIQATRSVWMGTLTAQRKYEATKMKTLLRRCFLESEALPNLWSGIPSRQKEEEKKRISGNMDYYSD